MEDKVLAHFALVPPTHMAEVPTAWWDQVLDGKMYVIKPEEFPFEASIHDIRTYSYRRAAARDMKASATLGDFGWVYLQALPVRVPSIKWPRTQALPMPPIPHVHRRLGMPVDMAQQQKPTNVVLVLDSEVDPSLMYPPLGSNGGAVKRSKPTAEDLAQGARDIITAMQRAEQQRIMAATAAAVPAQRSEQRSDYDGFPAEQALLHPDFASLRQLCTCDSLDGDGSRHDVSCPLNMRSPTPTDD